MIALSAGAAVGVAAQDRAIRREVFLKSPGKGTAVMAFAYYTKSRGGGMISIEQRWSRSDTIDIAYFRTSPDYGRTWSPPAPRATGEKRPDGMLRRHVRGGWIHPQTGRYIEFWTQGLLPTDDPLEGMRRWTIWYSVSGAPPRQIASKGHTPAEPLPGVTIGKNSYMLGDNTCLPIALGDGTILLPMQITPLSADGTLYNPAGAYTYHDAAVLRGRLRGKQIDWELGDLVKGDPSLTTRGLVEPTLAPLSGNRVLMILRGSNDKNHALPSRRWVSFSSAGGRRWTTPEPWTYDDGQPFFSPSACSQLVRHSSGRLFWFGNITPENPRGNRPRYPFIVGEVDRNSGLLKRSSVRVVDTLQPGEDPVLTLSNFYAREDRRTRELVLHMTRLFTHPKDWAGIAYLYRIAV